MRYEADTEKRRTESREESTLEATNHRFVDTDH